ncbi:hypothetical protein CALVIDRAFT_537950 [Calocera viscosa TUFC12733]|uniref:Uncharacterized protein n=1 Tax=Calocera viscosa (strain TUFC12733) TaxID=1330018 RepID=A0A167LCS5_CALVF|nr:hypothetical protein CALVIDRAFT_537950 [Calocera viscosa TUFC12733]
MFIAASSLPACRRQRCALPHALQGMSSADEKQWFDLLEEITRVMKPGATFEFVDEDILFPGLTKPPPSPRSSLVAAPGPAASGSSTGLPSLTEHSTASSSQEGLARASASGSSGSLSLSLSLRQTTSNGTGREAGPYSLSREELLGLPGEHDHSLIEKLFNSVFQNRGINMEPTGGVQMFINMYLVDVQSCPPLVFPAQVWGGKSAPRMPSYDTESLATMPNNSGLHSLSRQGYLPNESFNAQHMINAQHTVGPQQLAHVLAVREAMWEEYCRLRSNEHAVVEQRAQERLEIRQRQAEREAEAREGRLPPSIDLVGNEGTSEKHHQLIEHHQRVVEQETSRDAARLAELDRLERASQEERIKSRSRLRGNMPDEIVVDRVQLASGGIAEWTDVTVVLGPNDRSRDREVFDILVDRYERDMRYRTQHTDTTARYLHCAEPPRTHLTGDELAREDEWRRGFQEYMDRGNDEELVWRRMRMYTARKSRRRLGTERAGRI